MSLFDKIFGRPKNEKIENAQFWKTLTAYSPTFTSWSGSLYESELVRSAINSRASHISKLGVKIEGASKPRLRTMLNKRPNDFQTWSQFLSRLSTILDMQGTAFIVPALDRYEEITGLFTLLPSQCQILDRNGVQWLRFRFKTGDIGAVELNRVGIMTKFQYESDIFGTDNRALFPTMDLICVQNQGIKEGIKNSASFRFMAKLTSFRDPDDLAKEQRAFTDKNLSAENGGVLLFPNTWTDLRQIESKPYTIDSEQMAQIQRNVQNYFQTNEKIMNCSAVGDELSAFYDGAIEPVAIMLSEILTRMLFTDLEQGYGSRVIVSANRLQYMKTSDKIAFARDLGDRGFITINEIRELLNYPPIEGGNVRPARGEYFFLDENGKVASDNENGSNQPSMSEGEGESNGNE